MDKQLKNLAFALCLIFEAVSARASESVFEQMVYIKINAADVGAYSSAIEAFAQFSRTENGCLAYIVTSPL